MKPIKKCSKQKLLTIAVALATTQLAAPASLAQAGANSLEEVVVTARKRSENLQDVPMAVAAFSSDQLQEAQVTNIIDLERLTPNVTMTETSGLVAGALAVFVRGIGNDPGFDQGVGVYVDDVYLNRTTGALLNVYDVERIEILKGPQGNLYGRNTIGGAIKYVTREPGEELTGSAEVRAGEDGLLQVRADISGPLLADTLYGGLGVYYRERDGLQKNTHDGSEWWADEVSAFRANLLWRPTDTVEVKLWGDYTHNQSDPQLPNRVALDHALLDQLDALITDANKLSTPAGLTDVLNDRSLPQNIDHVNTAFGDTLSDFEIETRTVALTVEWAFHEDWLFKSVSAQRYMENVIPFDFDGSNQVFIQTYEDRESTDFSQEFQLLYSGESVSSVMGLYYLDATAEAPGFTLQNWRLQGLSFLELDKLRDDRDLESYSAYFNVDWDFADNWQWSIGGRYTRDEKTIDQRTDSLEGYYGVIFSPTLASEFVAAVAPGLEAAADTDPNVMGWMQGPDLNATFRPGPPYEYTEVEETTEEHAKADWDEFSPSTRLSWRPVDELMVYGGVSTGFKSGDFVKSGDVPAPYDPETVISYTLGFKSDLFDQSLRLNFEAFYNDYNDKQLSTIQLDPITGELDELVDNVGEATTTGAELELTWLPPVEGLVIGFNVGYLDSDIDSFKNEQENPDDPEGPPITVDLADSTAMGFSPRWTVQGRLQYDMALGDTGFLTLGTDVSYRSESYTNSPVDESSEYELNQVQKEHAIWNAMVAWRSPEENWRVALEGRNLEDTRVLTNSFVVGPFLTGGYNAPRSLALSVGYSF